MHASAGLAAKRALVAVGLCVTVGACGAGISAGQATSRFSAAGHASTSSPSGGAQSPAGLIGATCASVVDVSELTTVLGRAVLASDFNQGPSVTSSLGIRCNYQTNGDLLNDLSILIDVTPSDITYLHYSLPGETPQPVPGLGNEVILAVNPPGHAGVIVFWSDAALEVSGNPANASEQPFTLQQVEVITRVVYQKLQTPS
jgi:hypothetical protein